MQHSQTLFLMSFAESVTYMAELGSLADIFPVSPCKELIHSQWLSEIMDALIMVSQQVKKE